MVQFRYYSLETMSEWQHLFQLNNVCVYFNAAVL